MKNNYVILDNEGFAHGFVVAESSFVALKKFYEEVGSKAASFGSLDAHKLSFSKKKVATI